MKIKETIERECCDPKKDLHSLSEFPQGRPYYFCKHCGRHWEDTGGTEPESIGLRSLPFPWEYMQ